jgi:hypothetical protein
MTSLNSDQKQLLFDYCSGLTTEEQSRQAEHLIASNKHAAQTHEKLKATLAPLTALKGESCPDALAAGTLFRLRNVARSSQLRLEQLLEAEEIRRPQRNNTFWWNFGKMAAAAIIVFIILGTWFAPLDLIRQKYRQLQCQAQLARVFQGLSNYRADYDGQMPAVATAAGAPWWKVGYQGQENQSTTRNMWLLVTKGYAQPSCFVCPGAEEPTGAQIDPAQRKNYSDFPSRRHISYSVRIFCRKSSGPSAGGTRVLIADLSPLFENLPDQFSQPFTLVLDQELLTRNSVNHNRRGQNLLLCDGSVKFIKERHADISHDDIFTVREMYPGSEVKGCELPSCETDNFLAP